MTPTHAPLVFGLAETHPEYFPLEVRMSRGELRVPVIAKVIDGFTVLKDAIEKQNAVTNYMRAWTHLAGLGQYSLSVPEQLCMVARLQCKTRHPSEAEIADDLRGYGEQVAMEEVDADWKGPTLQFLGSTFKYTGPLRPVNVQASTRVWLGDVPQSLDDVIGDVQRISLAGDDVGDAGYELLTAKNGILHVTRFREPSQYRADAMKKMGVLQKVGSRLQYQNEGQAPYFLRDDMLSNAQY